MVSKFRCGSDDKWYRKKPRETFDSGHHQILVDKLNVYDIIETVFEWFNSYLAFQKQTCKVKYINISTSNTIEFWCTHPRVWLHLNWCLYCFKTIYTYGFCFMQPCSTIEFWSTNFYVYILTIYLTTWNIRHQLYVSGHINITIAVENVETTKLKLNSSLIYLNFIHGLSNKLALNVCKTKYISLG